MGKTVFYRQTFEAGAPFYVVNTTNDDFFLSYIYPYTDPLYPELIVGWGSEVYPIIGVDGSYALYSPCSGPPDGLEPYYGAVALAVSEARDGRYCIVRGPAPFNTLDPYYVGPPLCPLPWGGANGKVPVQCQTQVNRIEMDVQFTTRAFYEFGNPDEPGCPYVFYTGQHEGDTYGFNLHVDMNYNEDYDYTPGTHLWVLGAPIVRSNGSGYASDVAIKAWPESRFDLDGAFHHIRVEWQYATYDWNNGNLDVPGMVNADGWIRAYIDDELVCEALNQRIFYWEKTGEGWHGFESWMRQSLFGAYGHIGLLGDDFSYQYDNPVQDDLVAERGYTNLTGIAKPDYWSTRLTTADFYSEFARDFGSVQTDLMRVGMAMRDFTNPAGAAYFELDFSRATPGGVTQYFFGVRDHHGDPVLEFKREGTTLVVTDAVGELGRASSVLLEGTAQKLRFQWCFSSYAGGAFQADGIVKVERVTVSGYTWTYTTLFSLENAVVCGKVANLPYYWRQAWFCPQGDMFVGASRLNVMERWTPTTPNRWSTLQLGYWNTAGVYDNIELSYGENVWVPIANYHDVIVSYWQFKYGQARVKVDLWTSDGTTVKARLWNVTDGVSVGESVEITSTTPVETEFAVALTMGVKAYRLQVLTSEGEVDYFCVGQLMKTAGS